ncbi:glycosyltransferase 61 family protein [Roseomonas sp. WA12]
MDTISFRNVVVTPTAAILSKPAPFEFKGGPLWPDFSSQLLARHCRDREPTPFDSQPDPPESVDAFLPEAVWCGPVCTHFGHAITDFGMRIAVSAHGLPGLPLLFSVAPGQAAMVPTFFWGILEQFGVERDRVVLVEEPVRVGTLHVLPQAERMNGPPPEKTYLDLLDRTVRRQHDPSLEATTVYVSRGRFRTDSLMGRIAGETYLDGVLAAAGVLVVHPETLTVAEQVRLYQNAGRLLFSEGSALHGLQLLGRITTPVGVLLRRPKGRMASGVLARRAPRVSWINAMDGHICGTRRDGRGFEVSNGLMVLDPVLLLPALSEELGLDLAPHWNVEDYRAACIADVTTWINYRRHRRRRLGASEGDVEAIAECLRNVALLDGALDGYPLL